MPAAGSPTVHVRLVLTVAKTFAKLLLLHCFLNEGIDLIFCNGFLTVREDEGRGGGPREEAMVRARQD